MATATATSPITPRDIVCARYFGIRLPVAVPQPAPVAPPAPEPKPTGRCSLALTINAIRYAVHPMPREFGVTRKFKLTYQLDEPSKMFHVVTDGIGGPHCNCLDFRAEKTCHHILACRATGLID